VPSVPVLMVDSEIILMIYTDYKILPVGERNGITSLGGFLARMVVTSPEYVKSKYNLKMIKDVRFVNTMYRSQADFS
jgi:hypothetical protein